MKATAAVVAAVLAVVVLLYVATVPNAPPAEMTEAEIAQIEAEVMNWSDQWLEAATNLDAEGTAALMDPEDAHFVAGGTAYRATWAEYLAGSQELYGGWEVWGGEWDARRVDILGPGVALLTGQATGPVRVVDGGEFTNRVRLTFVVRKTEGEWKGFYGHVSGVRTPIQ